MGRNGGPESEETREKKRRAMIAYYAADPERGKRNSERQMGHVISAETRAKIGAARRGKPLTPEHKAKLREASQRMWESPEYREKWQEANAQPEVKAKHADADHRMRISEGRKRYWEEMDEKERTQRTGAFSRAGAAGARVALKGRAKTAEHRAMLSVAATLRCASPEFREKISRTQQEAWRNRSPEDVAKRMTKVRRALLKRKGPTSIERKVMAVLDSMGITYEPQKAFGPFVADIYLRDRALVIECDGDYWHGFPEIAEKDRRRDRWFLSQGLTVARLTESAINTDTEGCVRRILTV